LAHPQQGLPATNPILLWNLQLSNGLSLAKCCWYRGYWNYS